MIDSADQALAAGARVAAPVHDPWVAEASAAEVAVAVEASAAAEAAEVAAVEADAGKINGIHGNVERCGNEINSAR